MKKRKKKRKKNLQDRSCMSSPDALQDVVTAVFTLPASVPSPGSSVLLPRYRDGHTGERSWRTRASREQPAANSGQHPESGDRPGRGRSDCADQLSHETGHSASNIWVHCAGEHDQYIDW